VVSYPSTRFLGKMKHVDESKTRCAFFQEKVVDELLATEASYLEQLDGLLHNLIPSLLEAAKNGNDQISMEILLQAKNTLGPIYGLNSRLLGNLQRKLKEPPILSLVHLRKLETLLGKMRGKSEGIDEGNQCTELLNSILSDRNLAISLGIQDLDFKLLHRDVVSKMKGEEVGELLGAIAEVKSRCAKGNNDKETIHEFYTRPFGFVIVDEPNGKGHLVVGVTNEKLKQKLKPKSRIFSVGSTIIHSQMGATEINNILTSSKLPLRIKFSRRKDFKGCLIIVIDEGGNELRKVSLAKGIPKDLHTKQLIMKYVSDQLEMPIESLQFPGRLSSAVQKLIIVKISDHRRHFSGEVAGRRESFSRMKATHKSKRRSLMAIESVRPCSQKVDKREDGWGKQRVRAIYLVGHIFKEICPYFRIYTPYVTFYQRFLDFFNRVATKATSWSLFKALENLDLPMPYQQLIITPIQRVPRYKLLLQELFRYTESWHPDFEALRESVDMIHRIAAEIDRNVLEQQARSRLVCIMEKFEGEVQLITPSRRFIRSGPVTVASSRFKTNQSVGNPECYTAATTLETVERGALGTCNLSI